MPFDKTHNLLLRINLKVVKKKKIRNNIPRLCIRIKIHVDFLIKFLIKKITSHINFTLLLLQIFNQF